MSDATTVLREQADAAKVTGHEALSGALMSLLVDELGRRVTRSLLRSSAVAMFLVDRNYLITAADGGWYDEVLPVEDVIGTRLDRWPVWPAYERAFAYLCSHPTARACSYTTHLDHPIGSYFVLVCRMPHGWGVVCVQMDSEAHHLGDLTEAVQ